jgi:hypothetical protein
MNVAQKVQIYGFRDQLIVTTIFQLLQWKHALKLEIETGMTMKGDRKVSTFLRGKLDTPRAYPAKNILAHIEASLDDITGQFETGDFNLEPEVARTDHDEAAQAARRTQYHA